MESKGRKNIRVTPNAWVKLKQVAAKYCSTQSEAILIMSNKELKKNGKPIDNK